MDKRSNLDQQINEDSMSSYDHDMQESVKIQLARVRSVIYGLADILFKHRKKDWSKKNVILLEMIGFLQMLAFPFSGIRINRSSVFGSGFGQILDYLLVFPAIPFSPGLFWVIAILVFSLPASLYLVLKFCSGKALESRTPFGKALCRSIQKGCLRWFSAFSNLLFVPIIGILLQPISVALDVGDGSEAPPLAIYGTVGVFGTVVMLTVLLPLSLLDVSPNPFDMEDLYASATGRYHALNMIMRLSFVAVFTVLPANLVVHGVSLFTLVCGPLLVAYQIIFNQPFFHHFTNLVSAFSTSGLAWSALSMLAAQFIWPAEPIWDGISIALLLPVAALGCWASHHSFLDTCAHANCPESDTNVEVCARPLIQKWMQETQNSAAGGVVASSPTSASEESSTANVANTAKELEEKIMDLFQKTGSSMFPESAFLSYCCAACLFTIKGDTAAGFSGLHKAQQKKPMFDLKYRILGLRQKYQDLQVSGKTQGSGRHDLVSYIQFQRDFQATTKTRKHAAQLVRRFWELLFVEGRPLGSVEVTKMVGEIIVAVRRTKNMHAALMKIYRESPRVLRSYAKYLMDVEGERNRAEKYLEKADALQEHASKKMVHGSEVLRADALDDLTGIITINDHGIIQSVNNKILQMFGYKKSQMIGENVSMITPNPYRAKHDQFLRRYLETNVPHVIGKESRFVTGISKTGMIVPLHLSMYRVDVADEILFTAILQPVAANVGVLSFDGDMTVTGVNEQTCKLLRFHTDRMVGAPALKFIPSLDTQFETLKTEGKLTAVKVMGRFGKSSLVNIEVLMITEGSMEIYVLLLIPCTATGEVEAPPDDKEDKKKSSTHAKDEPQQFGRSAASDDGSNESRTPPDSPDGPRPPKGVPPPTGSIRVSFNTEVDVETTPPLQPKPLTPRSLDLAKVPLKAAIQMRLASNMNSGSKQNLLAQPPKISLPYAQVTASQEMHKMNHPPYDAASGAVCPVSGMMGGGANPHGAMVCPVSGHDGATVAGGGRCPVKDASNFSFQQAMQNAIAAQHGLLLPSTEGQPLPPQLMPKPRRSRSPPPAAITYEEDEEENESHDDHPTTSTTEPYGYHAIDSSEGSTVPHEFGYHSSANPATRMDGAYQEGFEEYYGTANTSSALDHSPSSYNPATETEHFTPTGVAKYVRVGSLKKAMLRQENSSQSPQHQQEHNAHFVATNANDADGEEEEEEVISPKFRIAESPKTGKNKKFENEKARTPTPPTAATTAPQAPAATSPSRKAEPKNDAGDDDYSEESGARKGKGGVAEDVERMREIASMRDRIRKSLTQREQGAAVFRTEKRLRYIFIACLFCASVLFAAVFVSWQIIFDEISTIERAGDALVDAAEVSAIINKIYLLEQCPDMFTPAYVATIPPTLSMLHTSLIQNIDNTYLSDAASPLLLLNKFESFNVGITQDRFMLFNETGEIHLTQSLNVTMTVWEALRQFESKVSYLTRSMLEKNALPKVITNTTVELREASFFVLRNGPRAINDGLVTLVRTFESEISGGNIVLLSALFATLTAFFLILLASIHALAIRPSFRKLTKDQTEIHSVLLGVHGMDVPSFMKLSKQANRRDSLNSANSGSDNSSDEEREDEGARGGDSAAATTTTDSEGVKAISKILHKPLREVLSHKSTAMSLVAAPLKQHSKKRISKKTEKSESAQELQKQQQKKQQQEDADAELVFARQMSSGLVFWCSLAFLLFLATGVVGLTGLSFIIVPSFITLSRICEQQAMGFFSLFFALDCLSAPEYIAHGTACSNLRSILSEIMDFHRQFIQNKSLNSTDSNYILYRPLDATMSSLLSTWGRNLLPSASSLVDLFQDFIDLLEHVLLDHDPANTCATAAEASYLQSIHSSLQSNLNALQSVFYSQFTANAEQQRIIGIFLALGALLVVLFLLVIMVGRVMKRLEQANQEALFLLLLVPDKSLLEDEELAKKMSKIVSEL